MKYEFASLRGNNFFAEGNTPEEAYKNLVDQEKDNGTLWRLSDPYMVEHCVARGWDRLGKNPGVAYRLSLAWERKIEEPPDLLNAAHETLKFLNANGIHIKDVSGLNRVTRILGDAINHQEQQDEWIKTHDIQRS